jgi:putative hydrolase of the HAD superfamily
MSESVVGRIEAISFDGDGTLWDYERSMRYALREVLSELKKLRPVEAESLTVEEMATDRETAAQNLPGASLEQIRLEAFRETLRRLRIEEEPLALRMNDLYRSFRGKGIELYDDVLPVLRQLEPRFSLGLLSNGNTDPALCGLSDLLSFVVFAHQHGVQKPHPALFEIAVREAGCAKDAMVHVGDSVPDDVVGARSAGILSVWLNREGIQSGPRAGGVWVIESLWGLLEILL